MLPTLLNALLRPVAGTALRWYYRSIHVAGLERVPATGPVFLAVNHPNALIDALMVAWVVSRPVHFTAKATLFEQPVVAALLRAAGVIPLRRLRDEGDRRPAPDGTHTETPDPQRNAAAFAAVSAALARGAAIVIFPEGIVHDDPRLAPLRTGLARMALAARDGGVPGITIVPIGLLFERKEQPRSRVLVQVGEPIALDALPGAARSVPRLTELVASRLADVTLNFESAVDAARLTGAATVLADLLAPAPALDAGGAPLADRIRLVRRMARAHRAAAERRDALLEARITAFEARLDAFRDRLAHARILAGDVSIDPAARSGLRFVLREAALATVIGPVALWGRVTHWLPIRVTRAMALRAVRTRDEPAMRTVLIGLVGVLAAYVVETAVVAAAWGRWWAVAFAATLVPAASADFRYADRARRLRARARAWRLFRRDPALHSALLAEAAWLRREAGALEQAVLTG